MESPKDEERVQYFNKCACCLEDGVLKDLWGQYITDGEVEIYGEMLSECLALALQDIAQYAEHICDKCIERLRYSLAFRREVLASKEVLEQLKEGILEAEVKIESEDQEGILEAEVKFESENQVCKGVQDKTDGNNRDVQEVSLISEDYSNIELIYVREEDDDERMEDNEMVTEYLEEDVEVVTEKLKRKQIYKKYSSRDLELAMQAVLDEQLSMMEAAAKYSIPIKTLRSKIKKLEAEEEDPANPSVDPKSNLGEFYKEIRKVLTYTNATPYKTKVGRFFCAYCSTQGPKFLDVHALRTHTRTQHAEERIKNVDMIMRPTYLNEVLKLDIYKLQCTVCMAEIQDWNGMFEHLKEKHDIEFEQAYTRIIPFVLDSNCECALCDKSFSHYHLLDVHMNTHYNNYICGECGDTFLSETRMKKHSEIHSTGKYPCPECGKEFSLEKYRKKHYDFVHLKEHKFKCAYCSEIFNSAFLRHQHVEKNHPSVVKTFECQHCLMTFTWRPYYLKHIRLNHSTKYQCMLCSKRFRQKHEIKNHLQWHKGTGYTCEECGKKFSSKNYLQKHMMTCKEVIVFQVS